MEKYINRNSVYVKKSSQENMILNYIEEHGCITNYDAIYKLGITQAPARIFGLKKRGIKIETRKKEIINRYNETIKVVEYYIKNEGEKAVWIKYF